MSCGSIAVTQFWNDREVADGRLPNGNWLHGRWARDFRFYTTWVKNGLPLGPTPSPVLARTRTFDPAIASRAEPWFELAVGMRVAFSSFKIDYVFGVKADIAQSVGNTRPER
jgi:hypothetical protein